MAKKKKDMELNESQDGLIDFYSSQSDLMFSQYKSINQLLGTTNDWSHPGSHCEILLRDFLRRNLPHSMSIDKGYIYGRASAASGGTVHSPEIDILIHNLMDYAPVFRLDDFVIVEPEAVLGIIQVKRSFKKVAKNDPLRNGLKQVIDAKQHLLDLLIQKRHPMAVSTNTADLNLPLFSAVVAIDTSFESAIRSEFDAHLNEKRYDNPETNRKDSLVVLPTFVGSLSGEVAFYRRNIKQQTYKVFESHAKERNISLQLLLLNLMSELQNQFSQLTRPIAFPNIAPVQTFKIPCDN